MLIWFTFQGIFVPCQFWWTSSACPIPTRCSYWTRNTQKHQKNQQLATRGCGLRRDHVQPHQVCVHRWQRVCQSLGHQSTWQQGSSISTGLFDKRQLYSVYQTTSRWEDTGSWWRGQYDINLGSCITYTKDKGWDDFCSSCLLCSCHKPWL